MRDEDVRELVAMGKTPRLGLIEAIQRSSVDGGFSRVGVYEGEPVCVFGVSSETKKVVGSPWLLGTRGIEKIPTTFLRSSRHIVQEMQDAFPVLTNIADSRNEVHLNWLRWLGFKFIGTVDMGGVPFVQFMRVR